MNKGAISGPTAVLLLVTSAMGAIVLFIGSDYVVGLDDRFRESSLPIVADRVESAIYAVDAFDEVEVELDLSAEYELEEPTRIVYGDEHLLLEPPVEFEVMEGGESDKICLIKNNQVEVYPGECE